jgi:hypothetical protein
MIHIEPSPLECKSPLTFSFLSPLGTERIDSFVVRSNDPDTPLSSNGTFLSNVESFIGNPMFSGIVLPPPPTLTLPANFASSTKVASLDVDKSTSNKEPPTSDQRNTRKRSIVTSNRKKYVEEESNEEDEEDEEYTEEDLSKLETPVSSSYQNDVNRYWKIVSSNDPSMSITITCKNRSDQPSLCIPDVMYSTLKYQLNVSVENSRFFDSNVELLHVRLSVYHPINQKVLVEEKLKGYECSLSKGESSYEGTLKTQFTEAFYARKCGPLQWQLSCYIPSDLYTPILIVRSAEFRVFARKPSNPNKKQAKHQKTCFSSSPAVLDIAAQNDTNGLEEFQRHLDELMRIGKNLKMNDRRIAIRMFKSQKTILIGSEQNFSFVAEEDDDEIVRREKEE